MAFVGNERGTFQNKSQGGSSTQKIRLRRVPTKQEIIKKNLTNLKQNAMKKQVAQEYYYSQKGGNKGRSPLKRQNQIANNAVQNRLGAKTVIYTNRNNQRQNFTQRRTPPNPGNRQFIKRRQNIQTPGIKIIRGNSVINNRMQRFTTKQSVQQRLTEIRQNTKVVGTQNAVQNKIRLRRPRPINYQIQVATNGSNIVIGKTKVLNPRLQAEIKAIQHKIPEISPVTQTGPSTAGFGTTALTLNERFTGMM